MSIDKEKQIEEMAKEMCKVCKSIEETCYMKKQPCSLIKEEAKTLYEQGYRKIPEEDSVVISKEEYEKLKHYEWRVTSGVCMTQKEWFDFCNEDSNRRTCLRIEEREKERKETAEKIYRELQGHGTTYVKKWIKEQFGVEIKE